MAQEDSILEKNIKVKDQINFLKGLKNQINRVNDDENLPLDEPSKRFLL